MSEDHALRRRIEQLQASAAAKLEPARLAQLEAMVRRLPGQRDDVRAVLELRIAAAIDALADQAGHDWSGSADAQAPAPRARRQRIAPAPQSPQLPSLPRIATVAGTPSELASVTRFRRTWNSGRAQESVAAAAARKPSNAGPLNSHVLVLQSLDMMRALPGDYLRRFLTHVESLQWLEAAQAAAASGPKSRRAKPRRGSQGQGRA